MSKPVQVDQEAKEELAAEVEWYDGVRAGLGHDLLAAVKRTLKLMEEVPGIGTSIAGVTRELGVRKVLVPRFPYAIVFVELPAELRVVAFAHGRRKPGHWRKRIK